MALTLKTVNAITLFVDDVQRSKEFYERVFGITAVDVEATTIIFSFDNVFMRLLERGAATSELLGVPVAEGRGGSSFELATRVDDVDAACAELAERGVSIDYGPVDRPWGVRHAGFRDPDGHLWVLSADITA